MTVNSLNIICLFISLSANVPTLQLSRARISYMKWSWSEIQRKISTHAMNRECKEIITSKTFEWNGWGSYEYKGKNWHAKSVLLYWTATWSSFSSNEILNAIAHVWNCNIVSEYRTVSPAMNRSMSNDARILY